jgi:4-amino-4-deoxy-L-arabinose transferase-like glycosyltransferase
LRVRPTTLPRHAQAMLTLGVITVCKLLIFLLLLETGNVQPHVDDGATSYYLPAANCILWAGAFCVGPDVTRSSKIAPGYPAFLALIQWISPGWYLPLVVCFQMVFDYAVAVLLLVVGMRQTSMDAGWLAGALWLVFPPAVVTSTWVTSETLFTVLLVLSMAVFTVSVSQPGRYGLALFAGLSLGVATLVRGTTQLFPLFLLAAFLGLFWWFRGRSRYLLTCSALLLVGTYAVVLPWSVRNLRVLGEPVLVQTGLGPVFLMGSRSEYFTIEGMSSRYQALQEEAARDGLPRPTDDNAMSRDRWHFQLGVREYRLRLAQEPSSLVLLGVHKLVRLWYGSESGTVSNQLVMGLCSLLTVPVGLVQFWLWRRDHDLLAMLWGSLILYFVLLSLVTLPMFRYALPLYPFLIFAASHRYVRMLRRDGSRATTRLAG